MAEQGKRSSWLRRAFVNGNAGVSEAVRLETRDGVHIGFEPADEWVSGDAINFHGRWVGSSNGHWVLIYGQVLDFIASTLSSDDPSGVVILFGRGKETFRLDGLSRPESVAISNAGVFAVHEWGPSTEFLGPRCRLRVFTSGGDCLLEHRAGAAMELPALSGDGALLAFHTFSAPAESPRPEDGASLFLMDLRNGTMVWQRPVPIVWPKAITFDDTAQHVVVHCGTSDRLRYTYAGDFLDADVLERVKFTAASEDERGYQLFELACARIASTSLDRQSPDEKREVEGLIRMALEKEMSPNTKARAHRLLGEIAELQDDLQDALREYTAALQLNPKVGLKKKVKSLEGQTRSTG